MQQPQPQPQPQTYLGERGYTIYKATITSKQLAKIKKDLTVTPFTPVKIGFAPPPTYPAYLDDPKNPKIYVPYFYGLREFGQPQQVRIGDGDPIPPECAQYSGHTLRENQIPVVEAYMASIVRGPKAGGLLELHTGFGKTLIAIYILAQLGRKTLIIVQKEFLMNQWLENIARALPRARIGRIQGEMVDINDKDIVIGMLQSLSMKDYPPAVFATFGLLIVDEVHHISSEVFSRALSKITTRYTLGLSATMDRKDRTSWVFKAFLGEVVYKAVHRDLDYGVVVRGIEYVADPSLYDGIQCDYKGNPLYSCMITRVCEYGRRTNFVLQVLADTLAANPRQQVMILAHNRSLLEYMHAAITEWGRTGSLKQRMMAAMEKQIQQKFAPDKVAKVLASEDATMEDLEEYIDEFDQNIDLRIDLINQKTGTALVGYYLGGMKERDLKVSEKKTVILATYAMASEALDIKTLTTLFLATSKTDVVQSVGRILRAKNDSSPVIYDFIDSHSIFKGQWRKRLAFYKREGYQVLKTTDQRYVADVANCWKMEAAASHGGGAAAATATAEDMDADDEDNIKNFSVCMIRR